MGSFLLFHYFCQAGFIFSCGWFSCAAEAPYNIPKSWQAKSLYNKFTFIYYIFWVSLSFYENTKCTSLLSLQCWWEVWCHVPHKCPRERHRILPVHPSRWNVNVSVASVFFNDLCTVTSSWLFLHLMVTFLAFAWLLHLSFQLNYVNYCSISCVGWATVRQTLKQPLTSNPREWGVDIEDLSG